MKMCVPAGIPSELHQVQALQLLTLLLPEVNREILRVKLHPDIVYTHK